MMIMAKCTLFNYGGLNLVASDGAGGLHIRTLSFTSATHEAIIYIFKRQWLGQY